MNRIDEAFQKIDRSNFLPTESRSGAHLDQPIPIGYEQTCSQPTTVKMMLEWLDAQPGDTVLDVGSGSGWTAALLSHLVGSQGRVYAVEKVPELVQSGAENNQRLGIKNVRFFEAGQEYGLSEFAPYDRILVSASGQTLPEELIDQLKVKGRLVIPIREDIRVITKRSSAEYSEIVHPGFLFVPLR